MENKPNTKQLIFYFAIIYAVIAIIFMMFQPENLKENSISVILGLLSLAIFISIPIVALNMLKKQGWGVTMGGSIKIGVLIGLLGGILTAIYTVIYFKYINPDATEKALQLSREILENNDSFDDELIEKQMEMTRKFFSVFQFIGQIFTGLLYGLIGGIIGGLFYKPKNTEF